MDLNKPAAQACVLLFDTSSSFNELLLLSSGFKWPLKLFETKAWTPQSDDDDDKDHDDDDDVRH